MKINSDLLIKIGIVVFLVLVLLVSLIEIWKSGNALSTMCEPYSDSKLSDVPAKCVEYFTPRRQDTIILR